MAWAKAPLAGFAALGMGPRAILAPAMVEVPVELGARSYRVHVGSALVRRLGELLQPLAARRLVLVSNPKVLSLHGDGVRRALAGLDLCATITIPDGERHKNLSTLARLYDAFARHGLTRDGVVLALGGGVVGDVVGLAAATWMRGIAFVQMPTTLLAMVDSSVGGKVAVNHKRAKNLIGAFHQPSAVVADLDLLGTLPVRQWRSGAYEMLKCGLIGARELFDSMARVPSDLRQWPAREREQAVAAAVRLKAQVVAQDEREDGLRRVLNLGHTLGHALEAVTHYRGFTHGEAVGWGLLAAARLALARGLVTNTEGDAIAAAVERLGPRPSLARLDTDAILAAIAQDKKARAGRVPFILPEGLGRVRIVDDVRPRELRALLRTLGVGRHG
jgi:3-dehydroquinate synthase